MFGDESNPGYSGRVGPAARYRCTACGNVTRFDVVAVRRTQAFHHYNLAGDLTVEDESILEERVAEVRCRWCGAAGDAIEATPPAAGAAATG
jgi:hypothetical protein